MQSPTLTEGASIFNFKIFWAICFKAFVNKHLLYYWPTFHNMIWRICPKFQVLSTEVQSGGLGLVSTHCFPQFCHFLASSMDSREPVAASSNCCRLWNSLCLWLPVWPAKLPSAQAVPKCCSKNLAIYLKSYQHTAKHLRLCGETICHLKSPSSPAVSPVLSLKLSWPPHVGQVEQQSHLHVCASI